MEKHLVPWLCLGNQVLRLCRQLEAEPPGDIPTRSIGTRKTYAIQD